MLPLAEGPCPSCVALLDQLDGAAASTPPSGINFAVVAKAPLPRILTFGEERGWRRLRLLSSAGNTYNRDYLAETPEGAQRPMLNVFHRDGETIRHFWGSELFYAPPTPDQDPRHVGTLEPLWNLFDLTPEGRPRLGRAAELRLTAFFLLGAAAIAWVVTADRMQGMDMGPGLTSARSAGSPASGR